MPSELSNLLFKQTEAQHDLEKTKEWKELQVINRQVDALINNCNHTSKDGTSAFVEVSRVGYDVIYECQLCGRVIEK